MDTQEPASNSSITQQEPQIPLALQDLISSDLDAIPENVLNKVTRGPLRGFILHADNPL